MDDPDFDLEEYLIGFAGVGSKHTVWKGRAAVLDSMRESPARYQSNVMEIPTRRIAASKSIGPLLL